MAKYTHDEVLRSLSKKRDCNVNPNNMTIEVLRAKSDETKGQKRADDLGNKSWGKIDYLRKHHGYRNFFVDTFSAPAHSYYPSAGQAENKKPSPTDIFNSLNS